MGDEYLRLFVEETALYNRIVLGNLLPNGLWVQFPHYFQTWLRNYIAGTFIYLASGFLWCLYIYYLKRNVYVAKGTLFACFFFCTCEYLFEICLVGVLDWYQMYLDWLLIAFNFRIFFYFFFPLISHIFYMFNAGLLLISPSDKSFFIYSSETYYNICCFCSVVQCYICNLIVV